MAATASAVTTNSPTDKTLNTRTSINLITGPLGSGKTTLVRHLIKQKPATENWVLLVNEFGAVGIDGAILSENPDIDSIQLPGGCICCTAKNELTATLSEVLQTHQPDRILIEPTGLGEPDTLVDTFQAADFHSQVEIQTLFAIFDSSALSLEEIEQFTILQNLLTMADVVVLNKTDLAGSEQLAVLKEYCESLYPAKREVLMTQQAELDAKWLDFAHTPYSLSAHCHVHHGKDASNSVGVMLPYLPINFDTEVQRLYKQELGVQSLGLIFSNQVTFDWQKLKQLFESLNNGELFAGLMRAKGVFKVGQPWMLFQWVNQHSSREYICYRRDSRIELLIDNQHDFDFSEFEQQLKNCFSTAP